MSKLTTILLAGFVTGILDILNAFASLSAHGETVEGVLKYIAAGVVGPAAMQGGVEMAWLGLFCHFALTMAIAAVFLFAALRFNALTTHPWLWGTVYGVLTWIVMAYVVVPMSAAPGWKLPEGWSIVSGLMSHSFYVGLPIAYITRWGLRDR